MKILLNDLKEYIMLFNATFLAKDVLGKSAQIAYYFVFSLFPICLLIVSLLPLLNIDMVMVENFLYNGLPTELADFLYHILYDAFTSYNSYIVIGALILTFWSASAATNAIMKGINIVYDGKVTRNFIMGRLISFLLTISFFIYIFVMVISVTLTAMFFDLNLQVIDTILQFVEYFILPLFMAGIIIIIYYVAPSKKMTIKQTLPGLFFWVIMFNIFTTTFSIYMQISDLSSTYGAFTGIIMFMLWCYALSVIILTGAVINVTLHTFITKKRSEKLLNSSL